MNFASGKPVYEQIYDHLKLLIEQQVYKEGDNLPSIRSLAMTYSVNPTTILRAFEQLEKESYIVTLPKKGSYVTYSKKEKKTELEKEIIAILKKGYTLEEIVDCAQSLKGGKK